MIFKRRKKRETTWIWKFKIWKNMLFIRFEIRNCNYNTLFWSLKRQKNIYLVMKRPLKHLLKLDYQRFLQFKAFESIINMKVVLVEVTELEGVLQSFFPLLTLDRCALVKYACKVVWIFYMNFFTLISIISLSIFHKIKAFKYFDTCQDSKQKYQIIF